MKNKWKDEVINQLHGCGIYEKAHETDPKKAVHDLIIWNMDVAIFFERDNHWIKRLKRFFSNIYYKIRHRAQYF
jgi:hypothetical protein